MKPLAALLALASLIAVPAFADESFGGMSGTVVDHNTKQPVANATVLYYKTPYLENGLNNVSKVQTDKHGSFAALALPPGRYIVMAKLPDKVMGCAVDDIQIGETTRIKMEIGRDQIWCSGPRVHPTTIDPNITADLYRI